jgi:hypothetical protein
MEMEELTAALENPAFPTRLQALELNFMTVALYELASSLKPRKRLPSTGDMARQGARAEPELVPGEPT